MCRAAAAIASSFRSSTARNLVKVCSRVVSSRNYVAKDINFGTGARAAMLAGVDELAEAVKVTMGPKVGGASDAEVGERKDRVTDALNATRAAVEEGIVPGEVVLFKIPRVVAGGMGKIMRVFLWDGGDGDHHCQLVAWDQAPTFIIASNAGVDGALVVGKLLEQDDLNLDYDAASGEYVNMVKAGIIDPVKVIRTALLDAASVSILLTTTEAAVVDSEERKIPLEIACQTWMTWGIESMIGYPQKK